MRITRRGRAASAAAAAGAGAAGAGAGGAPARQAAKTRRRRSGRRRGARRGASATAPPPGPYPALPVPLVPASPERVCGPPFFLGFFASRFGLLALAALRLGHVVPPLGPSRDRGYRPPQRRARARADDRPPLDAVGAARRGQRRLELPRAGRAEQPLPVLVGAAVLGPQAGPLHGDLFGGGAEVDGRAGLDRLDLRSASTRP